jgi:phosphoribosylanthranilate isomerase
MTLLDRSPQRIRIKLCEFECLDPAYEACSLDVDALGFHIFKHQNVGKKVEKFREIFCYLPQTVDKVLLTDVDFDLLCDTILPTLRMDTIQLYPDWPAEQVRLLRRRTPDGVKILKVMSACSEENFTSDDREFLSIYEPVVDGILLDSYRVGGTGKVGDWNHCAEIVNRTSLPVFLAGGLTPHNVDEAIRIVRPFGVDVESGVSDRIPDGPLVKNMEKCRRFVAAVRDAERSLVLNRQ